MPTPRTTYFLATIAAAAAGCGGGTGAGSDVPAQSHTSQAGQAALTYFGQPKPLTATSSGSISVLSQAGATYNSIQLQPAPNLDDTYLTLARSATDGNNAIYKYPYATAQSQLLFDNQANANSPAISAYGNVGFTINTIAAGSLDSIRNDGTGLTAIKFSNVSTQLVNVAYSTDGTNRIAFTAEDGNVYVGPGNGGTATALQSPNFLFGLTWYLSKVMFPGEISGGHVDIFTTATTGGAATDVTPPALIGTGNFVEPSCCPDGVTVAAQYVPNGSGTYQIVIFNINSPNDYTIITPKGDNDQEPAFAPDGLHLMFYRTNANGQTAGLYQTDLSGLHTSLFYADDSAEVNTGNSGLCWSPFLPKETVVAASGSTFYHQAASGFIMSEVGNQFGSFVAFTAKTPADAAIEAPSTALVGEGGQLIFTVTADAVTSIGYINNYFNPGTTISLTSVPTVVVTVDGTTGQVDLVAPAAIAKPAVVKNADGTVTYSAPFNALYNNKGQNLAPNGANQVTVNPHTGKLVSFR